MLRVSDFMLNWAPSSGGLGRLRPGRQMLNSEHSVYGVVACQEFLRLSPFLRSLQPMRS